MFNMITGLNIQINEERAEELGDIIARLKYKPISFDSPEFFPEEEYYLNYVFFTVAIDHRTHPLPKRFEGIVDGKFYHGSDLLFALARKAQKDEPDLFTAEKMIKITEKDISRIFSVGDVTIKNPAERAHLLRDCARKLIDHYEGDFRSLLELSEGYLIRENEMGILQQLRIFQAYRDPLMKKSYLLIKILRRQGYFKALDMENLSFPVDNISMEVALRSKLIDAGRLAEKIQKGEQLGEMEVESLRNATRQAFEVVSRKSKIPPDILDDLIWTYGREINEIGKIEEIEKIRTPLDNNIENKRALQDFLVFIGGFEGVEPPIKKLKLPETWYF